MIRPERNLDTHPYSPDEQRVAEWLVKLTGVGAGDDPIGFLMASHDAFRRQRDGLRVVLDQLRAILKVQQ